MTRYVQIFVYILLLVFPAASNLLEHGASSTYTILLLLGIIFWACQREKPEVTRDEKIMMATFAAYFLVCLVFFLANRVLFARLPLAWELNYEIRLLGFIPIFYLLLYRTRVKEWVLWYGLAAGAVAAMIYAILQILIIGQGGRIVGPYNPIFFGKLSLVYGFMCLAGFHFFYKTHPLLSALPVIGVSGGIYAALSSGSRGAIIAVPFFLIMFLLQLGRFKRAWIWRIGFIAILISVFASVYQLPGLSMDERIRTGIRESVEFFTEKDSEIKGASVRYKLWEEGWKLFKKHPLTGIGKEQHNQYIKESMGRRLAHFHNIFIEYMVVYGIAGLLAVIMLFAVPLWYFWRAVKNHPSNESVFDAAFSGLNLTGGFFIFALSSCIFYRNIFISVYIIMIAAISAVIKHNISFKQHPPGSGQKII